MALKPIILCILDGWGIGQNHDNPIKIARKPNLEIILRNGVETELSASEEMVGLPEGQMGNSEVGHMTIGSGRVIYQDLVIINKTIKTQPFHLNPKMEKLALILKEKNKTCHIVGLVSDGGVHSHIDHIIALADALFKLGVKTNIHVITDGRDTAPQSSLKYITQLEEAIKHTNGLITISTVCGRFYAMDRDQRWDRIEQAYEMLLGEGKIVDSATEAIKNSYELEKYDEFISPTIINGFDGIKDGDGLIIANFRSDRMRQILNALLEEEFEFFSRKRIIKFSTVVGITHYSKNLDKYMGHLFPEQKIDDSLGEIIAKQGLRQLRIAETEKYAHVTFFFNAGREEVFNNEERILIKSPNVETYDQQPEMSALEITETLKQKITEGNFNFIVVNFANADMVGHTGDFDATVKAIECIDKCLGIIYQEIHKQEGLLIVTADHGNAEQKDINKKIHTAHTCNPVPFILSKNIINGKKIKLRKGDLSDIAPTILDIMNIEKPKVMTGKTLIEELD